MLQTLELWNGLVSWVGRVLFHVEITVRPNGSGDTTHNYVQVFCFLVIAAAAAAVWSLLDRKRTRYVRLYDWLRVFVRFTLAAMMLLYGGVKVIKSQFPDPTLDRLLQPFGDASPNGLLWTFMGASESYTVFTGACEMLGGLLLCCRRTTLLGALVCIGVLANVVMLNFSYDVPVKLFSCHLLFMACFLAAPDTGRLLSFFVLNRPVPPADLRPLFRRPWLHRGALVLRTVLVLALTALSLWLGYDYRRTYAEWAPRGPLYGIWNVEELVAIDGRGRPAPATDVTRWRRVIFDSPQMLALQLTSDSRVRYHLHLDAGQKTLALTGLDDPSWESTWTYQETGPGLLQLEGEYEGKKIRARLRRAEQPTFRLLSRGFHWINEYPFNR
jgi:hypothetical protein